MTTLTINSADRNPQPRNVRYPLRRVVLAFGIAWYGALLAAALMPAQANAAGVGQAAQASVKETALTHRVPSTCTWYRCR